MRGAVGNIALIIVIAASLGLGALLATVASSDDGRCAEALTAADTVADAIESEWRTASEAVTEAQNALETSGYRELEAECTD